VSAVGDRIDQRLDAAAEELDVRIGENKEITRSFGHPCVEACGVTQIRSPQETVGFTALNQTSLVIVLGVVDDDDLEFDSCCHRLSAEALDTERENFGREMTD
jgi:hypothetical protein